MERVPGMRLVEKEDEKDEGKVSQEIEMRDDMQKSEDLRGEGKGCELTPQHE